MLRYASVCSGIEAPGVAFAPLGFVPVFFSEIEPFPSAVLAARFPSVPNLGDLLTIDGAAWRGKVDLLVAGTPCQSFSLAGDRQSLDDPRGQLTLAFARLCDAVDPPVILWENVPNVLNTPDNAFGCLVGALSGEVGPLLPPGGRWADAGYVLGPRRKIAWRILDAQHFGVPQRRRRVFLVASSRDWPDPRAVLFEREGLRGDPATSRGAETPDPRGAAAGAGGAVPRIAGALRARQKESAGPDEARGGHVIATPTVGAMTTGASKGGGWRLGADEAAAGMVVATPQFVDIRNSALSDTAMTVQAGGISKGRGMCINAVPHVLTTRDPAFALNAKAGTRLDYESETFVFHPTQDPIVSSGVSHALGVGGRGGCAPAAVAFAENSRAEARLEGGDGRQVFDGMRARRLTPVETERLQGFPDNWTRIPWRGKPADQCPDGPRYAAVGNSMATPVVRWIGARILDLWIP